MSWLPEGFPKGSQDGLCIRSYLTPEMGSATLDAALERFSTRQDWEEYAALLRKRVLQGAGLDPLPKRGSLKVIRHSFRERDGYSVENVAVESVPGYWVTGNLYRPLNGDGKAPAILNTHGHTGMPQNPDDWSRHGRFNPQAQIRCAALARMGAIVFSIDMFGYGDGIEALGTDAHRNGSAMQMQIWNGLRAVDFLESLPEVDATRIGVTGESGGGTQAFLLAALDERIAASVPVVMVSAHFFGGCPCESGMPIHRSADHFASNVMIAALTAPRPQLLVSDGGDWTLNTPLVEYPFARSIYSLYDSVEKVENAHFADEGHDYGPSKREVMYRFFGKTFELDLSAALDSDGNIDESKVIVETPNSMKAFGANHALPANALRSARAVSDALNVTRM
ncbi:hypothetical protein VDG1235_442 [Verrucomicrobiia bacterium DG1235]|nr:hypothetical protein VDG1235_442 [Verrucomicrobiae bacterium DG1235]